MNVDRPGLWSDPVLGLLPPDERRRVARGLRRARLGDPLGDLQALDGPLLERWLASARIVPATSLDAILADLWECQRSGTPIVVEVQYLQDLHCETTQVASVLAVSDENLRAAAAAVVPEHRVVVVADRSRGN